MTKTLTVKDPKGGELNVSVLGTFNVPDLDKTYIMYALEDSNPKNESAAVMLGEVIGEGEDMQIGGILSSEKELVVAYYNEIINQVGEDE